MCNQVVELLTEVYKIMREASIQNHSGHWDREGSHGAKCPECIRARKLRKEADEIYARAMCLNAAVEGRDADDLDQMVE